MDQHEQAVLPRPTASVAEVSPLVPEQRTAGGGARNRPGAAGHHSAAADGAGEGAGAGPVALPDARLRVDARRNLESVLRAARQVFGELGYGAPMEEVARRAGVGVGTVYRRFPSKEVLVRRIATEEIAWLTAEAREALLGEPDPWQALAGYLVRAAAAGAGRLLPPEALRYAEELSEGAASALRQRPGAAASIPAETEGDTAVLLELLGALVDRAEAAGALRSGVTLADVVLVLTAAVPFPPDSGGADQARRTIAPGDRLLRILLDGLHAS